MNAPNVAGELRKNGLVRIAAPSAWAASLPTPVGRHGGHVEANAQWWHLYVLRHPVHQPAQQRVGVASRSLAFGFWRKTSSTNVVADTSNKGAHMAPLLPDVGTAVISAAGFC